MKHLTIVIAACTALFTGAASTTDDVARHESGGQLAAGPAKPEAFDVIECSEANGMFSFAIPEDGAKGAADASFMLDAPAGKHGFVRAEGAGFATDAGPIRFNGTNLTGPANFPDHATADRLASRFASLGINCVRLHYMDTWYSNFMDERRQCLLADDSETQRKLSPEQFDKLDYLVAALKKKGIYVNMNLHVGRKIDERDGGEKGGLTKTVGHFMPRLVELHREYARDLLTHVNPYTGNAYVDEPAVAMIEISNEDKGLVYAHRDGKIAKWPRPFRDELERQWNAWKAKNPGRDYEAFIWDTELGFWKGMRDYVRDTLKARQPVSGTQRTAKYSPAEIQGALDYVDTHAYFHHPKGPGSRGWVDKADGRDWTAGGESHVHAMETLATLENESHVKGKPFTVSEYSNPYPSPFTAEGHPLACAYGAANGWDGVFQYSYNHYPEGFGANEMPWCVFDAVANPAVLVHFPACAAMMARGDVSEDAKWNRGEIVWNRERPGREYYAVNARNVKMFAGYPDGRTVSLGGVSLSVGDTMTRAAVVTLLSRDATGFGEAGRARVLIAASAACGNTGSRVERVNGNETRLVSRGQAPVLAEGVPCDVTLPVAPTRVKCWALAPDGSRRCEIVAGAADGFGALLRLSPLCKTLWYEVEIAGSNASSADFAVRDFGAKGDGATKDTAAIQRAIDECAASGGGRVVFSGGTFLSGALRLKSGVELHVDRTAKLLASPDIADFRDWPDAKHVVKDNLPRRRNTAFIFADEAERIAITGGGTIDCNGEFHIREKTDPDWKCWKYERIHDMTNTLPRVVFFAGCRDVVIRDVTMVGQPAGWSYWIHDCDRVQITSLKILANVRYPNNDGIHVNCSRDVTISDCIIETGDDSIVVRANSRSLKENKPCERVVVNNCTFRSWSSGIRIGWIDDGVIRDCLFSNIAMHDTSVGVSIMLPKRRNKPGWTDYGREATLVENLAFDNIRMNGIYARPILVGMVGAEDGTHVEAIRDIRFTNVHATGLEFPLMYGREGCPLRDFTFSNCSFRRIDESALPEDWRRHGYSVNDRQPDKQFITCHAIGFTFDNTRFDAP